MTYPFKLLIKNPLINVSSTFKYPNTEWLRDFGTVKSKELLLKNLEELKNAQEIVNYSDYCFKNQLWISQKDSSSSINFNFVDNIFIYNLQQMQLLKESLYYMAESLEITNFSTIFSTKNTVSTICL